MENVLFRDTIGQIMVERIERDYDFNMIQKHFHNEYEIYYLLNGERYYFIEKQIYHVKKGSLVFIDRNQIHKTVGVNSNYHDRILILISADEIGPILDLCDNFEVASFFNKNYGIIDLNEAGQKYVEGLLFFIIREMKMKQSNYDFIVKMKLAELLIYGTRCKSGENSTLINAPVETEKYKKINEIAKFISENYHESISLANIAEDFYISKCYLSRIFKEVTGFTVNEYINITRIKRAQQLLEQSEYNITEIADIVGYESITYFEKVFKKFLETSPLKYRKKFNKKV
ncbi:MAG: AraC family transcriptional regulator [Clostridiales bacterium]|jgi:AraC-like DNA-binding protein|nr:AraC family transcriptional regulator [Clostridiales bacterium]